MIGCKLDLRFSAYEYQRESGTQLAPDTGRISNFRLPTNLRQPSFNLPRSPWILCRRQFVFFWIKRENSNFY